VTSVTSATNADNAAALSGISLADLSPVVESHDNSCNPPLAGGFFDCTGPTLTLNRTADVLVEVTAVWHDGGGGGVRGVCRIERNGNTIGTTNEYGSLLDTTGGDQNLALAMSDIDPNRNPGDNAYNLACDETEANFVLEDVHTVAVALGS
jgi:hypothetical protein